MCSADDPRAGLLGDLLGTPLFFRARNNLRFTPQGERLVRHAETILNAWSRARHEVAVADDPRAGRLHRVADVPVMQRAAYAMYSPGSNRDGLIEGVLDCGLNRLS